MGLIHCAAHGVSPKAHDLQGPQPMPKGQQAVDEGVGQAQACKSRRRLKKGGWSVHSNSHQQSPLPVAQSWTSNFAPCSVVLAHRVGAPQWV